MPAPGTVLDGKYRLVRRLGEGGMGIVFEADHIRLRQPFAIKVLQPEFAKEREFLMRFEREARAAALLRGPHIVRVFDVDVSPEGLTYMVMELLEGRDLAVEATETVVPVSQLVDWIIQTCSGLQEAHDNGIVHRDLKPANIFLSKIESGERIAKVLDFGISKLEATSTSHLTNRQQGALGTPTFMAPEQIRNRRVDGRSDLWALGVILYRLLGSRWPFSGKGDQGYMAAVLSDPAIPFEMIRPDLPYELATVIMRALEKQATDRYATADEMATALMPFGSGRAPIPSRTSLPGPAVAGATPRATPRQVTEPMRRVPATAGAAVVMPQGGATRVDRAGVADTVVDASPPRELDPHVHSAVSPPATAFVPETAAAPRGRGRAAALGACLVAAGVGFGAYMVATAGRAPREDLPRASVAASAAEPPNVAIDLPPTSLDARPAPTGVPPEPSASAPAARKKSTRPVGSAAASATSSAPPTPPPEPLVPDHL